MATTLKLDPELRSLVERARKIARERGELRDAPWSPPSEPLPDEAKAALRDWVDSGDYDRAVAEVVGDDPELRTE